MKSTTRLLVTSSSIWDLMESVSMGLPLSLLRTDGLDQMEEVHFGGVHGLLGPGHLEEGEVGLGFRNGAEEDLPRFGGANRAHRLEIGPAQLHERDLDAVRIHVAPLEVGVLELPFPALDVCVDGPARGR